MKSPLSPDESFRFQWILVQKYMYFRNPVRPRWRFVGAFCLESLHFLHLQLEQKENSAVPDVCFFTICDLICQRNLTYS